MKKWLGVLTLTVCIIGPAVAQSGYPNRPVTLIVTSSPGGVTDVTGRALAQGLTEAWGQPVIVENKGGAAHIIGAGAVAKSAPDGYTLLGESGTFAVNPTLIPQDKVPYDTEKDFLPITGLVRIYQSLLAAKSLPVANAAELIALAKRKPDQLTYGTAGVGTALHMNAELFARMAGIHLVPVHYRGAAPALNDLIGGSINSMIVSVALGLPAYRAGQIKMLGVGAPKRMPLVSEVPTISESGLPRYQATAWFGLFAPARTPDGVVMKIDKEVIRIFGDPAFRERFLEPQMFESMVGLPNDFAAFVKAERAKWAKLIADAGIKIE